MKTNTKIIIGSLSALALTLVVYLVLKKPKNITQQEDMFPPNDVMITAIKNVLIPKNYTKELKDKFNTALEKMTREELNDVMNYAIKIQANEMPSDELLAKASKLGTKYGITI